MNGNRTADTNTIQCGIARSLLSSLSCHLSSSCAGSPTRAQGTSTHTPLVNCKSAQTINNRILLLEIASHCISTTSVRVLFVCFACGVDRAKSWCIHGRHSQGNDSNSNKLRMKGFINGFQIMYSLRLFKVESTYSMPLYGTHDMSFSFLRSSKHKPNYTHTTRQ